MLHWLLLIFCLTMTSIDPVCPLFEGYDICTERLERALEVIHRNSIKSNRLEDDENTIAYRQQLQAAPLEMIVSRVAVKLPRNINTRNGPWAQVERCAFRSSDSSIETRIVFNDLSVSGLVSLVSRDYGVSHSAETCKMTLRLRRAGIEFRTSPIARGRGTMRIRTESSFMEPRFASIYAYGCHTARVNKQIKRYDKWPDQLSYPRPNHQLDILPPRSQVYYTAEPRESVGIANEKSVDISNENRQARALYLPEVRSGIWRQSDWITKRDERGRRLIENSITLSPESLEVDMKNETLKWKNERNLLNGSNQILVNFNQRKFTQDWIPENEETQDVIIPEDLTATLVKWIGHIRGEVTNLTDSEAIDLSEKKRTDTGQEERSRETRDIILDDQLIQDSEEPLRNWQSRENIAKEMEDVFLRGASQALTGYIEKKLHPAIKETLMISMGYTISYG